ncbi:MAG: hypothetical protein M0Q46_05245 [Endomicrobiales bacterium]|nr:hypothetical protein [Endomicrobiales bacterium]
MLNILVITHGEFGRELIATAESIVGHQENVYSLSLQRTETLLSLSTRIDKIIKGFQSGDSAIILTDMLGGTPCNACLPLSANKNIEIISGVNLYMLISALLHRGTMQSEELTQKIIADGIKNITNAKKMFLEKLK